MNTVFKTLELDTTSYYITHFSIINGVLPKASRLTPREIEVVSTFLSLPLPPDTARFSAATKKYVKASLSLSDSGLSQHLSNLEAKGILYLHTPNSQIPLPPTLTIRSVLLPNPQTQEYHFKLINSNTPLITPTPAPVPTPIPQLQPEEV